jgi:hypothetical protein
VRITCVQLCLLLLHMTISPECLLARQIDRLCEPGFQHSVCFI